MLRLYEDVQEALAHSNRWQIPLLIFVHERIQQGGRSSSDFPELYGVSAGGRKTIDVGFRIGGESLANDAAAQKQVLEMVLNESRLNTVSILHFIESGSPAHDLFTAAVPDARHAVPRLHVFPPSFRELPRNVLHGATLTPGNICESVRLALRIPPFSKVTELRNEIMRQVEEVNSIASPSRREGFPAFHAPHHNEPVAGRDTAAMSIAAAGGAGGAGDDDDNGTVIASSPNNLHFVALNGLERREVVVTSSGMTLRTVWQKVQHALKRERESANVEPRQRRGTGFVLRVEPPATTKDLDCMAAAAAPVVVVGSIEEAARMDIHALPHNSVVTVVMDGDNRNAAASPVLPLEGNTSHSRSTTTQADENDGGRRGDCMVEKCAEAVCCEGGSCRIRPEPSSTETHFRQSTHGGNPNREELMQQPQHPKQPSTAEITRANKESETASPTAAVPTHISLRCSLPDGSTHTVSALDPAVATLSTHLRVQIASLVGNDAFVFARAYPPRRFTTDEEKSPLREIGLCTSSALRVVSTGGSSSLNAPPRNSEKNAGGFLGMVSSFVRRTSGAGNAAAAAAAATATAAPLVGTVHGAGRGARGGQFRTMSDILAEEEEEEKVRASMESAMQGMPNEHGKKKANRYYGGGSTEYIGRDDKDKLGENEETDNDDVDEEDEDEDHNLTGGGGGGKPNA